MMDQSEPHNNSKIEPLPTWTEQECWVWNQVCVGKVADFNLADGYGGKLDPKKLDGWMENRRLRQKFLEAILLQDPFRSALTRNGVGIVGAWFKEQLDLSGATVSHQLWLHRCRFEADVNLMYLHTTSLISMQGCKFTGKVYMDGLEVEGSLFMRNGAEFAEVSLVSASVGRSLEMDGSEFTGNLEMSCLQVDGSLLMPDSTVSGAVKFSLSYAKIGANLDFSGSTLPSLDLTGAAVRGEFRLGTAALPAKWHKGAKLTLRNTEVATLQDLPEEAWPGELELEGFTYGRLGGFQADSTTDMATQPISRLRGWLARQRKYSPQPYEQLASVLLKSGRKDKANEILYAGRERERKEGTWRDWLWLTLHKFFIGYGYRMHYAIYWVAGFVVLGWLVLCISGEGAAKQIGIAYSFDMLLPLVKLSEQHSKIEPDGWVRYYFYFHKLMGYVLGSFIVGGLSGLARK